MMPEVDILLATYQGAEHLPALLGSLEAQTHTRWNLILRDDGSADDSVAIVEAWSERSGNAVKVLRDGDRRLGPAASFGRLLAASEAPYFAFCDQDDVWLPEKLSRLIAAATEAEAMLPPETPVLAHCDLRVVDEALNEVSPSFWAMNRIPEGPILRSGAGAAAPSSLLLQNRVTGCALVGNAPLRRAALPAPPGAGMHDWWLALVAAYLGEIRGVATPLMLYRQHGGNVLGARGWSLLSVLQRGLKDPIWAVRRAAQSLRASREMARALAGRHQAKMDIDDFRTLRAYAELEQCNILTRKLFLFRHRIRPAAWIILPIIFALI